MPPVSTTLAKLVAKFAACVADTGSKFSAGVVDTGGKFATGVVNTGGAPLLATGGQCSTEKQADGVHEHSPRRRWKASRTPRECWAGPG